MVTASKLVNKDNKIYFYSGFAKYNFEYNNYSI